MKMKDIRRMPVTLSELVSCGNYENLKIHESVFRSYAILYKVKELLLKKVPHDVIIEIIDDLEDKQSSLMIGTANDI
jgi:hypothetical protein